MKTPTVATLTEELIADIARQVRSCNTHGGFVALLADDAVALLAHIADLKQQLAAASVDAGRYRWLRDGDRLVGDYIDSHENNICVCSADGEDVLWSDQLDAAIDASRAIADT